MTHLFYGLQLIDEGYYCCCWGSSAWINHIWWLVIPSSPLGITSFIYKTHPGQMVEEFIIKKKLNCDIYHVFLASQFYWQSKWNIYIASELSTLFQGGDYSHCRDAGYNINSNHNRSNLLKSIFLIRQSRYKTYISHIYYFDLMLLLFWLLRYLLFLFI